VWLPALVDPSHMDLPYFVLGPDILNSFLDQLLWDHRQYLDLFLLSVGTFFVGPVLFSQWDQLTFTHMAQLLSI
jgi:hypothetical protein